MEINCFTLARNINNTFNASKSWATCKNCSRSLIIRRRNLPSIRPFGKQVHLIKTQFESHFETKNGPRKVSIYPFFSRSLLSIRFPVQWTETYRPGPSVASQRALQEYKKDQLIRFRRLFHAARRPFLPSFPELSTGNNRSQQSDFYCCCTWSGFIRKGAKK